VKEESLAFNDYVRQRRLELGFSLEALCQKLGLKHTETLCMVETGERKPPLDRLPDLADALSLDRTELCRMFLKETAPKFSTALFAHNGKSPSASATSAEQPEPGEPKFGVIMFPHTGESILGEILP
jgi:transcriptional regulator with XRE-family HTH domain